MAFALARVYAGALLASHAEQTQARDDVAAASRWTASLASTHGLNLVVPTAASLEDGALWLGYMPIQRSGLGRDG